MSYFDNIFDKLFNQDSESPIIHEPIRRGEGHERKYREWKEQQKAIVLSRVVISVELKKKNLESVPQVQFLELPNANGLAVSYIEDFHKDSFRCLLDYWAELVKMFGYRSINADYMVREKDGKTEEIEKRFLKPILGEEKPFEQKYGNILIENVTIDGQPCYIKLTATTYSDTNYQTPLAFNQLLDHLLAY
jgi:hypothetical protein